MDNIKYISKEIWFEHAKEYIIEYIAHHKVYRWINIKYTPVDHSGIVEEVPLSELKTFLEKEKVLFWQESYLDCLYNGEKIPTYESSCGWYYNTFKDAILENLEQDFIEKMWQLNVPVELAANDDYFDKNFSEFYDTISCVFIDWIKEVYSYFTKEKIIRLIMTAARINSLLAKLQQPE